MGPRLVLLAALVLLRELPCGQKSRKNCAEVVSSDDAVRAGVENYQQMLNSSLQYGLGCCPKIVRPGSTGSVITGFNGYRGNVAIVVDWGTCTAQPPGGFYWYVSWGDYSSSSNTSATLGPFQVVHQYSKRPNIYPVYVYYCSNPRFPIQACCDVLYGTVFAYHENEF